MSQENVDIIFMNPLRFEECEICSKYIKENKVVSINLSELDEKSAERMLDYIAGSISVTGHKMVSINNDICMVIPSNVKFKMESNVKYIDEEEEIIKFRKK